MNCIAFCKHDGTQIRFGGSRKRGWHKFGTRHTFFDKTHETWGDSIRLFENKYAEQLTEILKKNKDYRNAEQAVAFCEYFGPSSFAGWHDFEELKNCGELVLFDVNIHKKGLIFPRDFIKNFGHIHIPAVVYEGNFNETLINDVRSGKYPVKERVVAKGVHNGNLWMAKVKTKQWLDELKKKSEISAEYNTVLTENYAEQQTV